MRLLLGTCVWGGAKRGMTAAGHDVVWSGDWAEDPGDEEILAEAHDQGRVLVTLDKDFGELAIVRGLPHCGIIRLVIISATRQTDVCAANLGRYAADLQAGAIITVTETRVRIRAGG